MLFGNFDIVGLLLSLPAIVLALSVHEYAHARAANRMGDPTARLSGRMTLEPWAHLDPVGTVMLILFRFGWAKPVPINPRNFRDPRRGVLLTSLAGPAANVILSAIAAFLLAFRIESWPLIRQVPYVFEIVYYIFLINLFFAVFNLIPIPPLDGSKILMAVLPGRQAYALSRLQQYGPLLLILFLFVGGTSILAVLAQAVGKVLLTVAGLIAGLFGL